MRPNVKFFCSLHLTAVISVVRKPYWTLITSQLAIRIFDAQNKHRRDKWKLRRTPVLQPRRNAYLQLVWITLCKLAKINSRAGTLNQEVIQITRWCPTVANAMFSFLFSLLDSFKSQEGFTLCARENAWKLVCESSYTFFSPRWTLSILSE